MNAKLRWLAEVTTGPRTTLRGWQLASCIALFAYLLVIAIESIRLGISGLLVEVGQGQLDRWTTSNRPRTTRDINRIVGYFGDSLKFYPDNPWAHEGLGSLNLARMRLSAVPRDALMLTRYARLRTREALSQRPTSPFLWSNLALSKLYLDEIDSEFAAALRYANVLGPWEPASQQTLLFVGLAAWDRLDSAQRETIVGILDRGAVRNAGKLFETVKSFRRFDLVCNRKDYDLVAGKECRSALDKARKLPAGKSGVR